MGMLPKGGAPAQALRSGETVTFVFVLGMFSIREIVQRIEDVGKDLRLYVASPQEIKMFVVGNFGSNSRRREFTQHGLDIYKGVAASID